MRTLAPILCLSLGLPMGHAATQVGDSPAKATQPGVQKPCLPCDEEDANARRGYPIRGRILGIDAAHHQVLVKHREIPGVMRAMTMVFNVNPAVLPVLKRDQELLGRIEKRGKEWWLFNISLLGAELK